MNIKIRGGCTRHVLLIGKYAIKIPRLNYGWIMFLKGLMCNMQEVLLTSLNDDRICPVKFSIPGGFLIVMPRCESITEDEFSKHDLKKVMYEGIFSVPVEYKSDSFGRYKGNIVALDYGS